jgi:hypothetical protein
LRHRAEDVQLSGHQTVSPELSQEQRMHNARTVDERSHGAARAVAEGVSSAVDQVVTVAGQTSDSVSAFRDAVRRAPLAMSLVMLGLGYLIGTIMESLPNSRR